MLGFALVHRPAALLVLGTLGRLAAAWELQFPPCHCTGGVTCTPVECFDHGRTLRTGCPGDSANCSGDCPWRSPSSVHHHRPNIGRCDAEVTCRLHCAINARFGVLFTLPHCAAPSRHQQVDVVNPAMPSQRPAPPSSRRATLSSAIPPCCPVHSLSVPGG